MYSERNERDFGPQTSRAYTKEAIRKCVEVSIRQDRASTKAQR